MKPNTELIEKLLNAEKLTLEELGEKLGYKGESKRQSAWAAIRGLKRLAEIAKILGVDEKVLIK